LLDTLKKLKEGHDLHAAFADLLNTKWSDLVSKNALIPQIQSTLPFALSFPPQIFIHPILHINFEGKEMMKVPYKTFQTLMVGNTPLQAETNSFMQAPTHAGFALDKKAASVKGPENDKIVCIWLVSSAPGMGKSVLTKNISISLKKKYSDYFIFEIHLLDQREFFAHNKPREITILQLLKQVEKFADCAKLLEEKRLAVLLDGFDEICPLHRYKVLRLIEQFADNEIPLWITTRPQEEEEIKKAFLGTKFATLQIQPLKANKQIVLIEKVSKMSYQKCSDFLDTMTQSGAAGLMENPLHLTLITEYVSKVPNNSFNGNVFELYSKIIKDRVLTSLEKQTIELEEQAKLLLVRATMKHYLKDSPDYSIFEPSEINIINRTGIMTIQNDKSSATYIHQTFAEILVTYDVLELLNDTIPDTETVEISLLLTNERFTQTRYFIEHFLISNMIPEKLETFLTNLGSPNFQDFLKVICKEGRANLFRALCETRSFETTKGQKKHSSNEITKALQEHFLQYLLWASKSSQELAINLLELPQAKEIEKVFLPENINILEEILQNTVDKNYVLLFSRLNDSCPETRKIMSFVGKHSVKDYFFLQQAAAKKSDGLVELLLDAGADANSIDSDGCTALYYAINEASLKCVQSLSEKNESFDVKDKAMALHFAASKCDLEIINCHLGGKSTQDDQKTLVALRDERINIMNYFIQEFHTQLDILEKNHCHKEIITLRKVFDTLRTKPNDQNSLGENCTWHENILLCEIFDTKQTNPNYYGEKFVWQEIVECHYKMGIYMVGFDEIEDGEIKTQFTIQREIRSHRIIILDLIINKLYISPAGNVQNCEPLMIKCMRYAAKYGNKKFFEGHGWGHYSHIITDLNFNLMPLLPLIGDENLKIKTPTGHSAVHLAIIREDEPLLKLLVEKKLDLQGIDKFGMTIIHLATLFCKATFLKLLLGFVDKELINMRSHLFFSTPIFFANLRGSLELVELLIEHGADPRARDEVGGVLFHDCALKNGRLPVMRFYLEKGYAQLNEKRLWDGYTALHIAAKYNSTEIIRFLSEKGADLREINKYGETALDVARRFNNPECIFILRSQMDSQDN